MASAKTIYVDLDDVLAETGRAFLDLLETDFGRRVAFEEIHSFDLGVSFGLSAEELRRFMIRAHDPEIMGVLEPLEGALEAMELWRSKGYELEVVTGRPAATREMSQAWLDSRRIPHHRLTFVCKYSHSLQPGAESDAVRLEDLDPGRYALAVEDSLETALFLAGELGVRVCLLDRPWNRSSRGEAADLDGRLTRCRDWRQVMATFPRP